MRMPPGDTIVSLRVTRRQMHVSVGIFLLNVSYVAVAAVDTSIWCLTVGSLTLL